MTPSIEGAEHRCIELLDDDGKGAAIGVTMSRLSSIPLLLMTFLMLAAPLSGCIGVFAPNGDSDDDWEWVDPVMEIEDANHSHSDLLAHRLATPNAQLIDYHNLNCDGNVKPPADLDNVAGRP